MILHIHTLVFEYSQTVFSVRRLITRAAAQLENRRDTTTTAKKRTWVTMPTIRRIVQLMPAESNICKLLITKQYKVPSPKC